MHASKPLAILAALSLAVSAHAASSPRAQSAATAGPRYVVPWIADDYTRAVAEARARHVPLFIEAWAPW
jgi:hypothetical protein